MKYDGHIMRTGKNTEEMGKKMDKKGLCDKKKSDEDTKLITLLERLSLRMR
jgi:hypothetical protein